MTYSQILKNPKWQKKRLEILQRDDFTCQKCFDTETTLHVHHCYYRTGKKPWEYENTSLVTLCEDCHAEETELFYDQRNWMSNNIASIGAMSNQFNMMGWVFDDLDIQCDPDTFFKALSYHLSGVLHNPEQQKKMIDIYMEEKEGKKPNA